MEVATEAGLGDLVERIRSGYEEFTPGGGVHWLYFCDEVRGNTKLARRPDPANPGKFKASIETRGQGGFIVTAPSNGRVHPSGGAYKLVSGRLTSISTLLSAERAELWEFARSFDETPAKLEPEFKGAKRPARKVDDGSISPGDDFNARAQWGDILGGWSQVYTKGDATKWRRAGKNQGVSASTKGDILWVYSTSTEFEAETAYTKFAAECLLHHDGNWAACVKSLVARGFGTWIDDGGQEHQNPRPNNSSRKRAATAAAAQTPDAPIVNRGGFWTSCLHNSLLWLQDKTASLTIRYDRFRQVILINDRPMDDEAVISLTAELETSKRAGWAQDHVRSALIELAHRNEYSSLAAYLDSCRWDGIPRLRGFFPSAYECKASPYLEACADVLFLSSVARAYQPGCQADVMVVLIGPQGLGKSMGIAALCPNPAWFADDLGCDLFDRKAGEGLRGKWMVEFSEFSRINRATLDVVKAFVSRRSDYYRPAYGRTHKHYPRTCIFVGTTNDPHPLHDRENRRFMPVEVIKADHDWIASNRDQLWGEAVSLYQQGAKWWVTDPTLLAEIAANQEEARQADAWEEILERQLYIKDEISMTDAAEALSIEKSRLDRSTQTRIGLALKALGYNRRRVRRDGRLGYVWSK